MKNNKTQPNPMEALAAFTRMMATPGFDRFFGGMPFEEKEKYPHDRLGDGYELREVELFDIEGKPVENREKYSRLYHNDLIVSEEIFRRGGTGGKFKDGYCKLIHYTQKEPHTEKRHGFDFGTHVIIDSLGNIKLKGEGISSYPDHIGGHLGSIGNYVYDLRTSEAIAVKSSTSITGTNCIIVDHRYDWYNKEISMPLGIYRIDFWTAEITKIDDVK